MERNVKTVSTVLVYEWADLPTCKPDQQTSLRAVVSCAVTGPKHRGDVITTPPTRRTTPEMEILHKNRLVESGEGRNPAS